MRVSDGPDPFRRPDRAFRASEPGESRNPCASTWARRGKRVAVVASRRLREVLLLVCVASEAPLLVAGPALVRGMARVALGRVAFHAVHELRTNGGVAVFAARRLDRVGCVAISARSVGRTARRNRLLDRAVATIAARAPGILADGPRLVRRMAVRATFVLGALRQVGLCRMARPTRFSGTSVVTDMAGIAAGMRRRYVSPNLRSFDERIVAVLAAIDGKHSSTVWHVATATVLMLGAAAPGGDGHAGMARLAVCDLRPRESVNLVALPAVPAVRIPSSTGSFRHVALPTTFQIGLELARMQLMA